MRLKLQVILERALTHHPQSTFREPKSVSVERGQLRGRLDGTRQQLVS